MREFIRISTFTIVIAILSIADTAHGQFPIIREIEEAIPKTWSMRSVIPPDSTGHPTGMINPLFALLFTPVTQSSPYPAISLYFYPISQASAIEKAVAGTAMLSSCIPLVFAGIIPYYVVTTPCDRSGLPSRFAGASADSLWQSLRSYFDKQQAAPPLALAGVRHPAIIVTLSLYSGRQDPKLYIDNSRWYALLRNRYCYFLEKDRATYNRSCPDTLGYRGVSISWEDSSANSTLFSLCSGTATFTRWDFGKYSTQALDPRQEFERMAIAACKVSSATSTALPPWKLLEGVPKELRQAVNTRGVIEIMMSGKDTIDIDFSLLDSTYVIISNSPLYHYIPDVRMIYLPYLSTTQGGWTVDALHDTLQPRFENFTPFIKGDMQSAHSSIDSLSARYFDPLKLPDEPVTAGKGFLVPTSEGGSAFWHPFAEHIGGTNRLYLFWAYSSDGRFDAEDIAPVKRANPSRVMSETSRGHDIMEMYDLRGRLTGVVKAGMKSPSTSSCLRIAEDGRSIQVCVVRKKHRTVYE